jgi:RNase P subunit RPR2
MTVKIEKNTETWVGFECHECGAPLGIHQSNNGSKPGERSARGWRVTCTSCGVTTFYDPGTAMVRIKASA